MSFASALVKLFFTVADHLRDLGIAPAEQVTVHKDLNYGIHGMPQQALDLHVPGSIAEGLPLIVSIHGGGWVYGNKEVYHNYCDLLAGFGFVVINANYRLAPENKFPAPLQDINRLMHWLVDNQTSYRYDLSNLFIVADSAGAQIACQYAAILTNPTYGALFGFDRPAVTIRAMGLNFGMYDWVTPITDPAIPFLLREGVAQLGADYINAFTPDSLQQLAFWKAITPAFPPCFIAYGRDDLLVKPFLPFEAALRGNGVDYAVKMYRHPIRQPGHVFHLDVRNPEGRRLNLDEAAFFQQILRKNATPSVVAS